MEFPSELYYTEDHEWVRLNDDGSATIGITDFAQSELGDIVYVEIETEGESLDAGDVFGTVEAVKTVSDLFMPVAGTVTAVNEELEANPESVNDDPYGAGWLIHLTPDNADDVRALLSSEAYAEKVGG